MNPPLKEAGGNNQNNAPSALGWTLLLFVILWAMFYGLFRALPYVNNGSDVVFKPNCDGSSRATYSQPIQPSRGF